MSDAPQDNIGDHTFVHRNQGHHQLDSDPHPQMCSGLRVSGTEARSSKEKGKQQIWQMVEDVSATCPNPN